MSETGVKAQRWLAAHSWGVVSLHPNDFKEPSKLFAARVHDPEHVQMLKVSFQRLATINEDIAVVITDNEIWRRKMGLLGQNKPDDLNVVAVATPRAEMLSALTLRTLPHLHTFRGDHSRLALQELAASYTPPTPSSPKSGPGYASPPRTQRRSRCCRSWGTRTTPALRRSPRSRTT